MPVRGPNSHVTFIGSATPTVNNGVLTLTAFTTNPYYNNYGKPFFAPNLTSITTNQGTTSLAVSNFNFQDIFPKAAPPAPAVTVPTLTLQDQLRQFPPFAKYITYQFVTDSENGQKLVLVVFKKNGNNSRRFDAIYSRVFPVASLSQ